MAQASDPDRYLPGAVVAETDEANARVYLSVAAGDLDRVGLEDPPADDTSGQADSADIDRPFDYGVTATDETARGNVRGDVLDEASARAPVFEDSDTAVMAGDLAGPADRFQPTSVDDLAGVERREASEGDERDRRS
jgi:hypothetical protein